jgi:hypothetical protein
MDTLKLGFTLDAYQDGHRWIKHMYPFAKVNTVRNIELLCEACNRSKIQQERCLQNP